jgi:hypothetical protein
LTRPEAGDIGSERWPRGVAAPDKEIEMAKRPTSKTGTGKATTRKAASPKPASRSSETAKKPAARSRKTVRPAASAPMQARASRNAAPSIEAIAARAYELFEARGGVHGHDMEDWLRAEADLRG